MRKLKLAAVTLAVTAMAASPAAFAAASSSHAGEHGNHCGLGHAKHVKGEKGLHIGQTCTKASHGLPAAKHSNRRAGARGRFGSAALGP